MPQQKFKEKVASRKFVLMIMIFLFSTFILASPALLAAVGVQLAALMTGGEYVSLIIGCFGIYSGTNVWQKRYVDNMHGVNNEGNSNQVGPTG
jgi:hypothetical protein